MPCQLADGTRQGAATLREATAAQRNLFQNMGIVATCQGRELGLGAQGSPPWKKAKLRWLVRKSEVGWWRSFRWSLSLSTSSTRSNWPDGTYVSFHRWSVIDARWCCVELMDEILLIKLHFYIHGFFQTTIMCFPARHQPFLWSEYLCHTTSETYCWWNHIQHYSYKLHIFLISFMKYI